MWSALTTPEGLAAWFGNKGASIDLRAGGAASLDFDNGFHQSMRVERIEEPTVFGFTWQIYGLPDDDARRTYVEFTLDDSTAALCRTIPPPATPLCPSGSPSPPARRTCRLT